MRKAFLLAFLATLLACSGKISESNIGDASPPDGVDGGTPRGSDAAHGCPSDRTTCQGVCTDLATNQDNCGACGSACAPMERCEGGACTFLGCNPELVVCDGICRSFSEGDACGSCGTSCRGGELCSLEQCVGACAAGLSACGNACADLAHDVNNCGACGSRCDLNCVDGHCTSSCPAGWKSCVAGCRDTANDRLHCGICGNACAPGEACAQGSCVPAQR